MDVPFIPPCDNSKALFEKRVCFDRFVSAVYFTGVAERMLLDFKFNAHLWLVDDFVDWLEAALSAVVDPAIFDLVLPMPVSLCHRIERSYNQSALLAKGLAKRMDRKFAGSAMRRKLNVKRQSSLDADARWENAKDSFAVLRPEFLEGRTVLVVDDILTTGATLSECARALKAAGAWKVWALTLARKSLEI